MTQEELIAALEELLSESMESVIERERTTFDKLAAPHGERMILFGTGGLGRRTLKGLRQLGREPLAFCDNNPALRGKEVEGVPVLSPENAVAQYADRATFVVTIWSDKLGHPFDEVKRQLLELGTATTVSFLPLYWKYPQQFLPYFSLDRPSLIIAGREEILKCACLLSDKESRLNFYQNIESRFLAALQILPTAIESSAQFKNEFLTQNSKEVFVDAGAYNGDTVRLLLNSSTYEFKEIIALEPDPGNLCALHQYIEELKPQVSDKIRVIPVAVSNKKGIIAFNGSGTEQAQISSSGSITVESAKIDDLFDGKEVSFIKMDIEGAEPEAIEGASNIIAQFAPVLAISVYHHITHLWAIALMLHRLNPDYSMFFRPHAAGGWDFILYAVPPHRLAT
jgi:FkbM family methyltransferase